MSRLQRSSVSFRRQGSSGQIWDAPVRRRSLDNLKVLMTTPTTATASAVAPLHADDRPTSFSPRAGAEPSSARSWRAGGHRVPSAGAMAESPDVQQAAASSAGRSPTAAATGGTSIVVQGAAGGGGGAHSERPARRRRRLSAALCACMGHPPASHAQQ